MLIPGLVSITFRQLAPAAVLELVAQAGLAGIEWGGDVHVPPGDLQRAAEVRAQTEAAGLRVLAYGSYFRLEAGEPFAPVLASAQALGAPLIRVWAGRRGSAQADAAQRAALVQAANEAAAQAATAGIELAYEYHDNTLTDTDASAQALLRETPGIATFWQPPHHQSHSERLASLRGVLPRLRSMHVFHWRGPERERRPLAEAAAPWRELLALAATSGRDHAALLEFVRGDDPAQFLRDAATLREILAAAGGD